MKAENFLIAFLTLTAGVLALFTVMAPTNTPQAYAGTHATGGDYTLISHAAAAAGPEELITIIDNREQKVLTYQFINDRFQPVGGGDLGRLFGVAKPAN